MLILRPRVGKHWDGSGHKKGRDRTDMKWSSGFSMAFGPDE